VHYFALFIAKCLLAREKVSSLSAPDLDVLHRALDGDNTYNLGAIIARRLHLNRSKGKIHGGIFATRLATHFNIQIHEHNLHFPKVYLDRQSMVHHQFLDGENTTMDIPYNMVFSVRTHDITPLPAPALFDYHSKGRYYVLESKAHAHNSEVVAVRRAEEAAPRASVSYHSDCYVGHGW
jgi:hypothetical protein